MVTVYTSIGSNIDRRKNVQAAIDALGLRYGQVQSSAVYETEAVGFGGDPFYNLVSRFETDESAQDVNRFFKQVEAEHGRIHGGEKFASRTLDIDLILYGDLLLDEPGLKLPRDEIEKYAFVLEPLLELDEQGVYLPTSESYADMWVSACAKGKMAPANRLEWIPQPQSDGSGE